MSPKTFSSFLIAALLLASIKTDAQDFIQNTLTSWQVKDGDWNIQKIAARASDGDVWVFWRSDKSVWKKFNISAQAGGKKVHSRLTSWVTTVGDESIQHLAGVNDAGKVIVFWWKEGQPIQSANVTDLLGIFTYNTVNPSFGLTSWDNGFMSFLAGVDASRNVIVFTGNAFGQDWTPPPQKIQNNSGTIFSSALTSWITKDGDKIVEHLAGVDNQGDVITLYRTPDHSWYKINVSNATGDTHVEPIHGLTSWQTKEGDYNIENLAGVDNQGNVIHFWWSTQPPTGWKWTNVTDGANAPPVNSRLTSWTRNDGLSRLAGVSEDGEIVTLGYAPGFQWRPEFVSTIKDAGVIPSSTLTSWTVDRPLPGDDDAPPYRNDKTTQYHAGTNSDNDIMVIWLFNDDWQTVNLSEITNYEVNRFGYVKSDKIIRGIDPGIFITPCKTGIDNKLPGTLPTWQSVVASHNQNECSHNGLGDAFYLCTAAEIFFLIPEPLAIMSCLSLTGPKILKEALTTSDSPIVIEGIVTESKASGAELGHQHIDEGDGASEDWNWDVEPDYPYQYIVTQGRYGKDPVCEYMDTDGETIERHTAKTLHCEWDEYFLNAPFRPHQGDRAWMMGRWIYDLSHCCCGGAGTEMHPPQAVAFTRRCDGEVDCFDDQRDEAKCNSINFDSLFDNKLGNNIPLLSNVFIYGCCTGYGTDPPGLPSLHMNKDPNVSSYYSVSDYKLSDFAIDYEFNVYLPPCPSKGSTIKSVLVGSVGQYSKSSVSRNMPPLPNLDEQDAKRLVKVSISLSNYFNIDPNAKYGIVIASSWTNP